jgi:hypothetical protein
LKIKDEIVFEYSGVCNEIDEMIPIFELYFDDNENYEIKKLIKK